MCSLHDIRAMVGPWQSQVLTHRTSMCEQHTFLALFDVWNIPLQQTVLIMVTTR